MKSLSKFLSEALVGKKLSSRIKRITSIDDLSEGDYFAVVGDISRYTHKPKRNIAIFDSKVNDSEYTTKVQVGCMSENQHSKPITINRNTIKSLNVESVTETEYKLLEVIESHIDIETAAKVNNATFNIIGYINDETCKIDMKMGYSKCTKNVSEALISNKVSNKPKQIDSVKDLQENDYFAIINTTIKGNPKRTVAIFDKWVNDDEYSTKVILGSMHLPQHSKGIIIKKSETIKNVESVTQSEYNLLNEVETHIDLDAVRKDNQEYMSIIGFVNNETYKFNMRMGYNKYLKKDISEALVSKKVSDKSIDLNSLDEGLYLLCEGTKLKYVYNNDMTPPHILIYDKVDVDKTYDNLGIDNINMYDVLELSNRMWIELNSYDIDKLIEKANEHGEYYSPSLLHGMKSMKAIHNLCNEIDEMNESTNNANDLKKLEGIVYIEKLKECEDFDTIFEIDEAKYKLIKK